MALCLHCGKRKAKRSCPALGNDLCSLCCGRLRERELHCPASCRYLSEHKPYQEKRTLDRRAGTAGRERRLDERLSWLVLTLEASLRELADRLPDFTDKDAALALAYAREKVERAQSVLIIPGEARRPQNEAGEVVVRALEDCRFRPAGLITTTAESYTREDRRVALDMVAGAIRKTLGGAAEERTYLRSLAARFDEVRNASRTRKILTSG
jgi:hypothetical protein